MFMVNVYMDGMGICIMNVWSACYPVDFSRIMPIHLGRASPRARDRELCTGRCHPGASHHRGPVRVDRVASMEYSNNERCLDMLYM